MRPFKSGPSWFLPAGMPGLLWVVPFSVPIPSLCPCPAQDFPFHVRSSDWLSVALRATEPPVLTGGRDNQTDGSSPRREAPPSRRAQLVSLTCPLPSKACCLFLVEDDKREPTCGATLISPWGERRPEGGIPPPEQPLQYDCTFPSQPPRGAS